MVSSGLFCSLFSVWTQFLHLHAYLPFCFPVMSLCVYLVPLFSPSLGVPRYLRHSLYVVGLHTEKVFRLSCFVLTVSHPMCIMLSFASLSRQLDYVQPCFPGVSSLPLILVCICLCLLRPLLDLPHSSGCVFWLFSFLVSFQFCFVSFFS